VTGQEWLACTAPMPTLGFLGAEAEAEYDDGKGQGEAENPI
jgi:hypothetical protein